MKRIVLVVAASLALLATGACSRYQTVKGDPMKTRIYTLDNGLKVYMTVNKETPRLQTYIAVRAGGKNGPDESTGLAHYFEHLMFKGTEQYGTSDYAAEKPMLDEIEQLFETYRRTTDEAQRKAIYHQIDSISYEASKLAIPNEYDKLMAVIGADGTNAWTSMDETVYTEDIPSNQIDNWARIQADRFKNVVLRGFHTELETIYEEKNMSLTQDSRKAFEALDAALFPHHPYGQRTVLGTQEHLKNPSITNVKRFHDDYYVPNNVAICVSGDFDPDEFVKIIEKYFGDWQPNPSVPVLEYEPEAPLAEPVVKDVYGLESENVMLGWRLGPATDLNNNAIAEIAANILYNGQAGLLDLDLNQQQKVLYSVAGTEFMPDYGQLLFIAAPKEGQTLEETRDMLLAEVARLRTGDFDESLIESVVNNIKLEKMHSLENNNSRAVQFVDAFINRIEWSDAVRELDRLASVTKDDIVAWAGEFLGENSYAAVFKRVGTDDSVQKINAPEITPIATNRDSRSAFLEEIQNTEVEPVEPVFVDFSRDMDRFAYANGIEVLYKRNELNDIFSLQYVFNEGKEENPALGSAVDYISYLGTPTMTAEEIATKMYSLGCSFSFSVGRHETTFGISGLAENMEEAMGVVEDLVYNAAADEDILTNLKSDVIKSRVNAKTSQRSCYSALSSYMTYGAEAVAASTLDNDALMSLSSGSLLSTVKELYAKSHEIRYYGPDAEQAVRHAIASAHPVLPNLKPIEKRHSKKLLTPDNTVVMAQYDSKQIFYYQYSDRGETLNVEDSPAISLYNEYFGGGMNTVVFQEMREARGLAYSAWATLSSPSFAGDTYSYRAFIATQNDKMQTAIEAFDEIINNMPESEAAFDVAKSGLDARLRTQRTTGAGVISSYVACRELGIKEPLDKLIFERMQDMTIADVKAVQEKWVKDRKYTFGILGDINDLDVDYLRTIGPVSVVSLEDIFGY